VTAAGPALALVLAAALPDGAARWRFELGGEHVGVVDLSVRCLGDRCTATWRSERRPPAEAGARRSTRTVEVEVDREGRWRGGRLRVVEDGAAVAATGRAGAVPASLAEVALQAAVPIEARRGWQASLPAAGEVCLEVFDEATGAPGRACARPDGEALAATAMGVAERIAPGPGGFPAAVTVPAHGARFVRDDEATAPREPPRLHGVVVPGPAEPERAGSFCGVARDPEVDGADLGFLPAPSAAGASCREKTAAWLARAARAGLEGRTAVGVAWDGERFVWHAWAEVKLARGWVPVDPSFGELPARGPRFTVARWTEPDRAAKLRAGERILACWAKERVRER
jgi:hypothetical protein